MLMPDPAAALAETCRVLRPGGRVAFAVWASAPDNPWGSTIGRGRWSSSASSSRRSPTPPGCSGWPTRSGFAALVVGAGLAEPQVDDVEIAMRYASFDEYWAVTQDSASVFARRARAQLGSRGGRAPHQRAGSLTR